jgi:hypothetical protein
MCDPGYQGTVCEIKSGSIPQALVELPSEQCIRKIVILKHGKCTSDDLTGAVVVGATSSGGFDRRTCGSVLTAQQVEVQRSIVDVECDPPLTAKFVTLDIPLLRVTQEPLCEMTIKQATEGPCDTP